METSLDCVATSRQAVDAGIYPYGELMNLEIERPNPAIEGLAWERQNEVFVGEFAVGKTMFQTQQALSLATGRDFLGRKVQRPYRVAFIDGENDLGDIKGRLAGQQSSLRLNEHERKMLDTNLIYVSAKDPDCSLYGMSLDRKTPACLQKFIIDYQPEVVVIDNLGLFAGDLEDAETVRSLYAILKTLRKECSSMRDGIFKLLHHVTKPGDRKNAADQDLLTSPRDFLYRARGSARLLDFAENRLGIARDSELGEDGAYIVNGINRSGNTQPLIMGFCRETLSFELHNDSKLRQELAFRNSVKQRELFGVIEASLPAQFTWTQVEQLTDKDGKQFHSQTISRTLDTACFNQLLSKRNGKYVKLTQYQQTLT